MSVCGRGCQRRVWKGVSEKGVKGGVSVWKGVKRGVRVWKGVKGVSGCQRGCQCVKGGVRNA